MPIDINVRIAAWLHIALGALAVSVLLFIGLAFGAFGAFMMGVANDPQATGVLALIGGFGATFLIFFIGLAALEIAGAAMLLNGSAGGRVLTIIFSILALLNFPIGTALDGELVVLHNGKPDFPSMQSRNQTRAQHKIRGGSRSLWRATRASSPSRTRRAPWRRAPSR